MVADLPGRPLVSASLILTGGAVEEPADAGGATVLAARALTEGTERYDAIELIEAAERLGASLHAEAGWDALTVGVDVPADRLEPALELVAEVLLQPTFPASEVERLRDERLNDLLQAQADPRRRVEEAFVGTIYAAEAPYHRPSGGTRETVERPDGRRPPRDLRADAPIRRGPRSSSAATSAGSTSSRIAERLFGVVDGVGRRQPRRTRSIDDAGTPSAAGPRRSTDRARSRPRSGSAIAACRGGSRLPRRVGDERDPRRAVQLAAEHEAARGEGLHVRRGRRVRHAPRRRSVRRARRGEHRGHRAGHRRHAGRARRGCATRRSTRPSSRPPGTSSSASSRCGSRPRAPSSARWAAWRSTASASRSWSATARSIEAVDVDAVAAAARAHLHVDDAAIVLVGDVDAFGAALEAAGLGRIVIERDEVARRDRSGRGGAPSRGPVDDEERTGPTAGAEEPALPGLDDTAADDGEATPGDRMAVIDPA